MAPSAVLINVARASLKRSSVVSKATKNVIPACNGHTLTVPQIHNPIVPFENGVPAQQYRELEAREKKWDFWTTSDVFSGYKPKFLGLSYVPYGETWVMQRGGQPSKVLEHGVHFLIPGVDKLKAVKSAKPVVMGVLAQGQSKDGKKVDAYAVVYVQVTDAETSAFYLDVESNLPDSERAAAKTVRKILEREIENVSVAANGQVGATEQANIVDKISAALRSKEEEFGLTPVAVEIRGVFPAEYQLADKLRALDPPLPPADLSGHNLSADYWSDVLSPPFFEKRTFGSNKEVRTPATVSLEWSIPSPPDYHHFNEVPRMVAPAPSAGKEVAKH